MDAHPNFAYSTVLTAPSPATTGTSLTLTVDFPASAVPPFNATVYPAGSAPTPANSEIVRVTADASGVLTIVRHQEGSSARSIVVGDQIEVAPTGKSFTDIEGAVAATNALQPADYVLTTNGTTVTATPSLASNSIYSGTDGAAVLTSAKTALGNVGTIKCRSGDYPWASVVQILPNYASGGSENPRKLRILGNCSRIVLSTAGYQAFNYQRNADHDSFANNEIAGFIVDAAGQPATGYYHALIGTAVNGVSLAVQRCNFYNQHIHDNRVINMTADPTGTANARYGIWIESTHITANEGTNNYMLNIILERNRFEGGNVGAVVAAVVQSGTSLGVRIYGGGWLMRDMWHSTLITPSSYMYCSNFQFGGDIASYSTIVNDNKEPNAGGLVCERLYGYGSGDDGLETNGFETMAITDCVMEDSWTEGYFPINFNYVNGIDDSANARQTITYTRCKHRVSNHLGDLQNFGWNLQGIASCDIGTIAFIDCGFEVKSQVAINGNKIKLAIFHQYVASTTVRRIVIRNFTANFDSVTNSTGGDGYLECFDFNGGGPTELDVKGVRITAVGANTGAGNIYVEPFKIQGVNYIVDIDGVSFDDRITGRQADTTRFVEVGPFQVGGGNSVIRGKIAGVRWLNPSSSDNSPRGVWVYGTGTNTITPKLTIERVDMAGIAGATKVYVADATNAGKTEYIRGALDWPVSVGLEAPAFAASYTPDVALGPIKTPGVLTAGMTINAPINPGFGAVLEFVLTQDGTGGRAVTWNGAFVFQVAWTNTGNTANKRSYARFVYNGTNWISTTPTVNSWF